MHRNNRHEFVQETLPFIAAFRGIRPGHSIRKFEQCDDRNSQFIITRFECNGLGVIASDSCPAAQQQQQRMSRGLIPSRRLQRLPMGSDCCLDIVGEVGIDGGGRVVR
jgi:hypothetical protein